MPAVLFDRAALDRYPNLPAWRDAAPELALAMLERWRLVPGEAFTGGVVGVVLPVTTDDGADAVLKIGYPHHEAVGEAVGLDAWSPGLAPRVLRQDALCWALLLERVQPGIPLSRSRLDADDAIAVAGGILSRLHGATAPAALPGIADVVGVWLRNAKESLPRAASLPAEREAVLRRLADAAELLDSDSGRSVLHGDANPGNFLLGDGGRWLAIDPKPMRGDPEFDLGPAIEQIDSPWGHESAAAVLRHRMQDLVERVGADWSRAVRWAAVRSAFDAAWAWEDGDGEAAGAALERMRTWERLSES